MKRIMVWVVLCLALLLSPYLARAARLSLFVSCIRHEADGSLYVRFGYETDVKLADVSYGYTDDWYMNTYIGTTVEAGRNAYAAEGNLGIDEDSLMLWMDGREDQGVIYSDEVIYDEVWVNHTVDAPPCGDDQVPSPPVLDDQGVINNPTINERANTCYNPGQVCQTDAEWERGWYLIREQYGVMH